MKSHAQVAVIGGGIVGCSVLYHLTRLGYRDVILIERSELTAGSTWHAAAGFHSINSDPNVAMLQDYTIKLYRQIEAESGRAIGLHMTGGVTMAGTVERWEWLKASWALFQSMGLTQIQLLTPAQIEALCPIADIRGILGGLYDPNEGHLDPYGATHAFATAAKEHGAEVMLRNRVINLQQRADATWSVVTEQGTCVAQHVVNSAGLWAKQVGLMAGVDLPLVPMEHHYLITEPIPEIANLSRELPIIVDLDRSSYLRQEGQGVLMGTYEPNPRHWNIEGAPWDFGMELIPEDVERIAPELAMGFARYPSVQRAGVKRWVNGAISFTPDGNPLVGPAPGVRNCWLACGVMAGFSQAGGIGRTLAEWIVQGEPRVDAFGVDIARFGSFAANRNYLKATTAQFYSRRFVLSYPNEQLPAGRPLRRSGAHDALNRSGARWGVNWGLEVPLYFAPTDFTETPSHRRSEAHNIVARECQFSREAVGCLDISGFSRYAITGPAARRWLDKVLAAKLPNRGAARLAPMLSHSGRLIGDFTVFNWDDETWWLMGSYHLRCWHLRWMRELLPPEGVNLVDLADTVGGFSIFGPNARALLARLAISDVSKDTFEFFSCRVMDVGMTQAHVARLSITGELGYELNVPVTEQATLYESLVDAGRGLGLTQVGYNAALSLRMEKSVGIWGREFTWAQTPRMCGLDRFIAYDKGPFIGQKAVRLERETAAPRRSLVTIEIDAIDADAVGGEPIWRADQCVGYVTSGAYGYTVSRSLAMAYLDADWAMVGQRLELSIIGERRSCNVIAPSPFDPRGARMRN